MSDEEPYGVWQDESRPDESRPDGPGPDEAWPGAPRELGAPRESNASRDGFDVTSAASTRAILLASWLGAAALIGARLPLAGIFESHSASSAASLALALAAFAPGMIGYGLSANLSRVLYAQGRNRASALAVGLGWVLVSAADVAIVPFVPRDDVVPALGVGASVGLTLAGVALLLLVRRVRGTVAVAGGLRAFLAGLLGCAVSALVGAALSTVLHGHGFVSNIGISVLVTLVISVVFTVVVVNLDGGDLRVLLGRLRTRASFRPRART